MRSHLQTLYSIQQRYRHIPPSDYAAIKEHVHNCSQLNQKMRRDAFPLPRIEETLDAISGAQWFSTVDLVIGYNQVPVAEQDKSKAAFCTPFRLFEFNRMPIGLSNAPNTFQRLMERMFGDQEFQTLLLYLDDIIVISSTVTQHLERMELVFSRLQQEGLKAKLEKCCSFRQEVHYLHVRHVVSREGVSTDPGKISTVAEWRRPGNVAELRFFLGFAELLGTKKRRCSGRSIENCWTPECEQGFQCLKKKLITAPVLAYADFSRPFVLDVDSSHSGPGVVLS
ncbi:hypothetical protein QQF64_003479 [Cirrhinus molitorella]|uniref:ribonuclease H n=1 Tax=Cirrhinus molitorella TaxID=172907 RepID=A0ABR3MLE6_9TELE